MLDYKAMYFRLAARVADAADILLAAQAEAEDTFISDAAVPIALEGGSPAADDKKDRG